MRNWQDLSPSSQFLGLDMVQRLRRALLVLVLCLPMAVTSGLLTPPRVEAAYAYTFGTQPYGDVLTAAANSARCGLTQMQLAALMLAPTYPETGASGMSAPSPMTLSRYDNQAALYSFSDKATAYPNAFWHPGIGAWAFDSAGGWDLTAAEAINTDSAARQIAEVVAQRWCSYSGDPTDNAARRKYSWSPWVGCNSNRCETIYGAIFDPDGLKVNLDSAVTRGGGMQARTCRLPDLGTVTCHYVDPAAAQGFEGFAVPRFGPSPISAPFYVIRSGEIEIRWWLRQDSGYDATISAQKLVRVDARKMSPTPAITWATGDGLCDVTLGKGACGVTTPGESGNARYHALSPVRLVDSRPESRVGPFGTPWGTGETREIQIGGVAGIASGATAVALNVTAVNPSENTHVKLWAAGQAQPATSNLNAPKGDTRANLVIVALGVDGKVALRNNYGNVDIVVDAVGWYSATAAGGGLYNAISPVRIWDTRSGPGVTGRLGATQTRNLPVAGVSGVPAGATAVVLNVTGVKPTLPTHLTVWPTGSTRPQASHLNVPAGDIRANMVVAKVGQDGTVSIYNNAGTVDLVADVVGWFGPNGATFTAVDPARLWDSRTGPGTVGRLGTGGVGQVVVAGSHGVPSDAKAVVLNLTAVAPEASTHLSVWPSGSPMPLASNLNVPPGDTRANLVTVKVGVGGRISVYNNFKEVDVVADLVGWYR